MSETTAGIKEEPEKSISDEMQKEPESMTRRNFFSAGRFLGAFTGIAALSLVSLGEPKRAYAQRPPGALPEKEFISRCLKCGQCIRSCPYDSVFMAEPGSGISPGTPYIVSRNIPCYMCPDIPCVVACPSGALDKELTDINESRMGLAVLIDRETCIALKGFRCEVCYNACPLLDKALTLEYWVNTRTGKHAIFEPVVHSDACTGCGKCEHACILDKSAIKVLDIDTAKGQLGKHYRIGWERERL